MTITLNYGVIFGKGDGSDIFEWEVELTEEQEAVYRRAVMTGADLEDVPELEALCDEVRPEIEEWELDNARDCGDEYALECLGENEMDADEINDLVHSKDPHAIEFFGLSELSDEELEEWDANDLDELPMVKDFDEDFEPESPFDQGWYLRIWFPEEYEFPSDEEIETYLDEALEARDVDLAEEIVAGQTDSYSGDLAKVALRIAAQQGCEEYIRAHECD